MSSFSLDQSLEPAVLSVASSRQVVKLTFTQLTAADGSTNEFPCAPAVNILSDFIDCDNHTAMTSSNTSTLSRNDIDVPHESRVRPPMSKQKADISLLMKDLDELTSNKKYSLNRGNNIADGVVVFLIEKEWWKDWLQSSDTASDGDVPPRNFPPRNVPALKRINNWQFINLKSGAALGDTLITREECSEELVRSRSIETNTYYQNRFHLTNNVTEDNFKIVTYEVWTTLCAWYGGGPPLPATIIIDCDAESDLDRERDGRNSSHIGTVLESAGISGCNSGSTGRRIDVSQNHTSDMTKIAAGGSDREKSREKVEKKKCDTISLWPMCPLSLEDLHSFQSISNLSPPHLSDSLAPALNSLVPEDTSTSFDHVSDEVEVLTGFLSHTTFAPKSTSG